MKNSLAPIVLFVYNRPNHTKQTIEALQKNVLAEESELFIYSDAPKNESDNEKVGEVRKYINTIEGFKKVSIVERDENCGLANSIIDGVTNIVDKYEKIIVLEDDLITGTYFLKFMNEALHTYEYNDEVASISGYMFPVDFPENEFYFFPMISSWGWATWKSSWKLFEKDGEKLLNKIQAGQEIKTFDLDDTYPYSKMLKNQIKGKNNSWAIRWNASLFINKKLSIWPSHTLIENIGLDGSGTHCNIDYHCERDIFLNTQVTIYLKEVFVSVEPYATIKQYFRDKDFSRLSIQKIMLKLTSLFIK